MNTKIFYLLVSAVIMVGAFGPSLIKSAMAPRVNGGRSGKRSAAERESSMSWLVE